MASDSRNHDPLDVLTVRQRVGLSEIFDEVRLASGWSWQLPVLLQERSWLRLMRINLRDLSRHLPPDGSEEAPELSRFRDLLEQGIDPLQAQQRCWAEFGMEDCHRALRRYWDCNGSLRDGWTLSRYLDLVSRYRHRIDHGETVLPLLVLAQQGSREGHRLHWVTDRTPTMRHTCA